MLCSTKGLLCSSKPLLCSGVGCPRSSDARLHSCAGGNGPREQREVLAGCSGMKLLTSGLIPGPDRGGLSRWHPATQRAACRHCKVRAATQWGWRPSLRDQDLALPPPAAVGLCWLAAAERLLLLLSAAPSSILWGWFPTHMRGAWRGAALGWAGAGVLGRGRGSQLASPGCHQEHLQEFGLF